MLIPDEVNNAIVVRANAVDYGKIKKAIETLDLLPRAVLIEVTIAEVDLTKDLSYGLQYFFQQNPQYQTGSFGFSSGGLANAPPSSVSSTTVTTGNYVPVDLGAAAGAGVALSWLSSTKNFGALLTALATKTNVTVLATPTLLTTDNTPASIAVGGPTADSDGYGQRHNPGGRPLQHNPVPGNRRHPEYNPAYKRRRLVRLGCNSRLWNRGRCDGRVRKYRPNIYPEADEYYSSCTGRTHGYNRRNNPKQQASPENRNSLSHGHTPSVAPFLQPDHQFGPNRTPGGHYSARDRPKRRPGARRTSPEAAKPEAESWRMRLSQLLSHLRAISKRVLTPNPVAPLEKIPCLYPSMRCRQYPGGPRGFASARTG